MCFSNPKKLQHNEKDPQNMYNTNSMTQISQEN